ncbi:MAG: ankyrin repeat domain-containing protein [Pseudomonadota bacterium]
MTAAPRRFYVIAPGGQPVGYDTLAAAAMVARQYGEGTHIVDTMATPYHPMAQRIEGGEPTFLEYGAWETRLGTDRNLIEAVKKGYAPIVHAFLAKGANINATDEHGGTALIWAVARRSPEIVRLLLQAGADLEARDSGGTSALQLAKQRNLSEIAAILIGAGARD